MRDASGPGYGAGELADPSPSEGRSRAAQPAGAAIDVDACEWLVYERLLPAVPVSVPSARGGLSAALVRHRLVGRRRDDVLLVLTEAATNAVWHAYRDTAPGPLYVNARLLGESLVVTVADRGRWPGRRSPSPGLGLGLRLMRRLADELKISHDAAGVGTCVQATFAGVAAGRRSSHAAAADGDRGELLREYLRLLSAAHASLQQDARAILAQAEQTVAHARRQQAQRARRR